MTNICCQSVINQLYVGWVACPGMGHHKYALTLMHCGKNILVCLSKVSVILPIFMDGEKKIPQVGHFSKYMQN